MSEHSTDDTEDEPNEKRTDDTERDDGGVGLLERRNFLRGVAASGVLGAAGTAELVDSVAGDSPPSAGSEWEMKEPQIETPWTQAVGPDNAHPEYPRPQMVREAWQNLNGVWQFSGGSEGESPPIGGDLDEQILVPYPVEAGLSGIKRHETWMWYRRQFEVPNEWLVPTAHSGTGVEENPNTQRLLLHFERVDWEATVYVNGEEVTRHTGGYDHFVADITDALADDGPQELVVGVFDPTGANYEPIGTQPKGRQGVDRGIDRGLWKMSTSGIWDTVWIEPVPETHVERLEMTPDLDAEALRLTVEAANDATVVATAYDGDEKISRGAGPANEEMELPVPDPRLWSPDDPFRYDLLVELRRADGAEQVTEADGGKLLDSVESYFGMRSLGTQEIAGTARPTLNGEMIYYLGSLESGMWPDGLYTAPTDEALVHNLELQKELGYNTVRKHSKIETRRWFYHADRLGLLVWQDMPNMEEFFDTSPRDETELEQFEAEFRDVIAELDTHPSLAIWTPFNEGWGINNDNLEFVREMTEMVSQLDPDRLVDANSGYDIGTNSDSGTGDIKDVHQYGSPQVDSPDPESDRISALGEYTSQPVEIEDHSVGEWEPDSTPETFVSEYVETIDQLRDLVVGRRLSASVYTATTDLYGVWNGHITYDRKVLKPELAENGLERVQNAHKTILEQAARVMGNVKIDVEAPGSYVSGQFSGEAQPFGVDVTLANPESSTAVAATVENVVFDLSGVPDEWTVERRSESSFDAIVDGESTTASWEITPDTTSDGEVTLGVGIEYAIEGERYAYADEVPLRPTLLASYRFEGDLHDSSGNDNAAVAGNDAGFDEVAIEGESSLALDGTDDYALLSGFDEDFLSDAFAERTVSTWIRPDSTDDVQCIWNEGGHLNGMGFRINGGTLEACAANNGTTVTVTAPFERTEWTHVAAVFDRGALRIYAHGEEIAANEDIGFDTVPEHVAGADIGGSTTTTPWAAGEENFFGGHIDATDILSRALSAGEIETMAQPERL